MEGFSDLLFLLIMFLVISRSFGAAKRNREKQEQQASQGSVDQVERPRAEVQGSRDPGLRSGEQMRSREQMRAPRGRAPRAGEPVRPSFDPTDATPGGTSRAAKRSDPVSEFRRRLIEAAREWEAEQRRRAGIPIEGAEGGLPEQQSSAPAQPPRQSHREAHPAAREARQTAPTSPWRTEEVHPPAGVPSRWLETHDVTPDRAAAVLAGRAGEGLVTSSPRPSVGGLESDPLRATHDTRGVAAEELGADESRELAPHERKTISPLARLERFPPLKRAVILAEILGRPDSR
jgi:hypothetical protein